MRSGTIDLQVRVPPPDGHGSSEPGRGPSLAFAIDRQLQCVSPSGRPSCVSRTISSTLLAGIDGLRPRPLATRPNSRNPSAANRLRQPTTVLTATPHSAAILALATPSPANSRALDRTTSRCAAEVDLDNVCKVWRCPSDKASAGAGLFIAQSIARQAPIARHYTSAAERLWAPTRGTICLSLGACGSRRDPAAVSRKPNRHAMSG